ncbi:M20 family metallopeptidase [Wukongibacter baidiensis]|uniref:M20 family metallopeptidase n=1 Tax=Wukongibacter baidiensis TaxID=1723361 RepID=UPI003D7FA6D3
MKYKEVLDILYEKGLINFTKDIVRIESVFNSQIEGMNESKVTEYISRFLRQEGFEVHIEDVVPGRSNIIAFLRGGKEGKTILFEGHQDVVSAGNYDIWTYHPFGGEIVKVNGKDRMYGRGTNDTKGNLAASIFAVKAIKDSEIDFNGNILLCITVDEEGLMIGIKDFIKKGWADKVDAAVICEPEEKNLCIFQKGALRVEIIVHGTMSHGAMPLSGNDPNWGVAKIITELRKLENFEKDRLEKHEYLGWPSFTPTMLRSPVKGVAQINVVPANSYLTLDIRTVPGQDHEAIKRQIKGIINRLQKQYPDGDEKFNATMKILDDRPWTETSKDEPVVKAIAKAHKEVMNKEAIYNGVPGATNGTFLSYLKNIPVIVTGAGDREIPHQVDEWVEIQDLIEISKIYALTALYFLNDKYE